MRRRPALQDMLESLNQLHIPLELTPYKVPSSHFCFIQRIYQGMKRQSHGTLLEQQKRAVPDGLQQWGLERFMFSAGSDTLNPANSSTEAFLSKETGYHFIAAYFTIIHPHMPILNRVVVEELWEKLWGPPLVARDIKSKDVVYMVLALGARTIARDNASSAETLDSWADYFWAQSNELNSLFQEPSLRGIYLLLLKVRVPKGITSERDPDKEIWQAIYAFHGMRPNDAYLYLGHAARSTLALGLNRSQVANGNGPTMHRLRVTFWVVYYYERLCAFFTGRPSGFFDTHIDSAFPEDFTTGEDGIQGSTSHGLDGPAL
ncbi:hypothetical protein N7488_012450 [Penicillium malachiteum]|nr:hypothetical protein N7488_012450 [Penicillium malachiteum]